MQTRMSRGPGLVSSATVRFAPVVIPSFVRQPAGAGPGRFSAFPRRGRRLSSAEQTHAEPQISARADRVL